MRVVSNKALVLFSQREPRAATPLQAWRRLVEERSFAGFSELKAVFGRVDKVGAFFVFDIGGNKFRVVAAIHFDRQMLYVRHVFTHREYDRWAP